MKRPDKEGKVKLKYSSITVRPYRPGRYQGEECECCLDQVKSPNSEYCAGCLALMKTPLNDILRKRNSDESD